MIDVCKIVCTQLYMPRFAFLIYSFLTDANTDKLDGGELDDYLLKKYNERFAHNSSTYILHIYYYCVTRTYVMSLDSYSIHFYSSLARKMYPIKNYFEILLII